MVNIMRLVGRNLVHLCHCMDTSVGSIGLDLNFYMSGTNVLDLILQEQVSNKADWKNDTSEAKSSDR